MSVGASMTQFRLLSQTDPDAPGPADEQHVDLAYAADDGECTRPPDNPDEGCLSRASRCSFCNEKILDAVTGIVILANVVMMGLELDFPWDGYTYVEQAMLVVYILDVLLRIRWSGFGGYLSDKSHLADIAIVTASVLEVWVMPLTLAVEESLDDQGNHKKKRGSLLTNMT